MVHFLSTDNYDKLYYGGVWGPNFLNDGVIVKDFLQTGLAEVLVKQYQTELQNDFQKKYYRNVKNLTLIRPMASALTIRN